MSTRIAVTAALLAVVAAVCSGVATAAPAAEPATSDYSPAQVEALADGSPGAMIETAPVPVSPEEAYATDAEPGAEVEGDPLSSPASATALCWAGTYSEQWGIWPLYQKVISHDTWCSTNWSHLYYHSNYVTAGVAFCWAGNTFHFRVAGGVSGQKTDEWHVGGYFSCPTDIPGVDYNPTRSFDVVVSADGGYYHG